MGQTKRIENANGGKAFNVRIVDSGDSYGLDWQLTHDGVEPMVEFYDATYEDDARFSENGAHNLGQFVSRYDIAGIAGHKGGVALSLDYSIEAWTVDADAMDVAKDFAQRQAIAISRERRATIAERRGW